MFEYILMESFSLSLSFSTSPSVVSMFPVRKVFWYFYFHRWSVNGLKMTLKIEMTNSISFGLSLSACENNEQE